MSVSDLPGGLPREIWGEIISYLELSGMKSCSEVSKEFNSVTVDTARCIAKKALETSKTALISKVQESKGLYETEVRALEEADGLTSRLTADEMIEEYQKECDELENFINSDCFDEKNITSLKDVVFNTKIKSAKLHHYLKLSRVFFCTTRFFPKFARRIPENHHLHVYFNIFKALADRYVKLNKQIEKRINEKSEEGIDQMNIEIVFNLELLFKLKNLGFIQDDITQMKIKQDYNIILIKDVVGFVEEAKQIGRLWGSLVHMAVNSKDENKSIEDIEYLYNQGLPKGYISIILELTKSFQEENLYRLRNVFSDGPLIEIPRHRLLEIEAHMMKDFKILSDKDAACYADAIRIEEIPTLVKMAQRLAKEDKERKANFMLKEIYTSEERIEAVHKYLETHNNEQFARIAGNALEGVLKMGRYAVPCLKFLYKHPEAFRFIDRKEIIKCINDFQNVDRKGVIKSINDSQNKKYATAALKALIELDLSPKDVLKTFFQTIKQLDPEQGKHILQMLIAKDLPRKYIEKLIKAAEAYPLSLQVEILKGLAKMPSLDDIATLQLAIAQLIGDNSEHREAILAVYTQRSYQFSDNIIIESVD